MIDTVLHECYITVWAPCDHAGASLIRGLQSEIGSIDSPQQKFEFRLKLTSSQVATIKDRKTIAEVLLKVRSGLSAEVIYDVSICVLGIASPGEVSRGF